MEEKIQVYNKTVKAITEGGFVSQFLNGYEFRPQQVEMAKAVAKAIEEKSHLIVEAGTGVGKSFSYLIPFVLYAVEHNKKVVVSTNTKTLQSQLYLKDLSFLRKSLGVDFRYSLCLGSENYLCLRRLSSDYTHDLFDSDQQRSELSRIIDWSGKTQSGIKSELGFVPKTDVWESLCRDSDLCVGRKCIHQSDCFYKKAKKRELESHILVTNHALFFTNLASGGNVLPAFDAVVFDEAQTLEGVATSYLGFEVSNTAIKYLFDSIYNPKTKKGILIKLTHLSTDAANDIQANLALSRKACNEFFNEIEAMFGKESDSKRIRKKNILSNYLETPLKSLSDSLSGFLNYINNDEDEVLVKSYLKRCLGLSTALSIILNQERDDYVYWIEILKRKRETKHSLFAAPVDIAKEMRAQLFDKISPVILTSATLAAGGDFEFIKSRLGLDKCQEKMIDSPFPYMENALLYMPEGIKSPTDSFKIFEQHVARHIKQILDITKGRTFILFTSYGMLNKIYNNLSGRYNDINLLRQGDRPRYDLLEEFKEKDNSVLLGTLTFWQGIDVPGRALECVIITKLPFTVPDDPVTEARMELIESRGGNPFLEYQVPQAIMLFKQGFGRLIRRNSDRGVVVVLDPRIKTRYYGKSFINALPECRHTDNIDDVNDFLKKGKNEVIAAISSL